MILLISGIFLKNDTNGLIYKTETHSQTRQMNLWWSRARVEWRDGDGVWDWHVHIATFKIDNQQVPTVSILCLILCNNLNGKRIWKGIVIVQSLSCVRLCDPMNCSSPGLPVRHQLPEFSQTHVHRVGDAIQPSHPLSSPSPPAPNPSRRSMCV